MGVQHLATPSQRPQRLPARGVGLTTLPPSLWIPDSDSLPPSLAQYTLMFETLLASPEPWLYAHVMLPGGTKNLTNPAYALGGGAAPLHGTIMQVIAVQREADSRLTLLVHGIGRCIVLRATQESPYARADVQSLPDDECLVSCAHRVLGFLGAKAPEVPRAIRRRLLMASAASENLHWRQYEFANHTLSQHLSLSLCDSSEVARGCRDTADAAHTEAMLAMPLAPHLLLEPPEDDTMWQSSEPVLRALDRALDAMDEDECEELDAEGEQSLTALEVQVWLELDLLLRRLAQLRGPANKAPVPSQLLGLLPPPPPNDWPDGFALAGVASQLRQRYEGALAEGEAAALTASLWSYVPISLENYPARRRVQRLSYAVWSVIGGQGVDLQPLVEVESTCDRLRLALRRMRDVMTQLE